MLKNTYKIIDFHTHPFLRDYTNICMHLPYCNMSAEQTKEDFSALGVEKICGSVLSKYVGEFKDFDEVKAFNDEALLLKAIYGDFYIPGFHVHPNFVKQSIAEIERMHALGVKLIGELCPYLQKWKSFADKGLWEILEVAEQYKMVVNFHGSANTEGYDGMDAMVKRFPKITFVGAHPSEGECFTRHIKRLEDCENYYVDLSGGGLSRMGTLRRLLTAYGKERVLFGSDYPVCNLASFIGGVALDTRITEEEKEYVFYKNAERILGL